MSDFFMLFGLIPKDIYGYILASILFIALFWKRIPILNKIDIRFNLPEEFMRSFRWITPLMVAGQYVLDIAEIVILLKVFHLLLQMSDVLVKIAAKVGA